MENCGRGRKQYAVGDVNNQISKEEENRYCVFRNIQLSKSYQTGDSRKNLIPREKNTCNGTMLHSNGCCMTFAICKVSANEETLGEFFVVDEC